MTEPGTVPEADRAEQEALVDPPEVAFAGDATSPPADVGTIRWTGLVGKLCADAGRAVSGASAASPPARKWRRRMVLVSTRVVVLIAAMQS